MSTPTERLQFRDISLLIYIVNAEDFILPERRGIRNTYTAKTGRSKEIMQRLEDAGLVEKVSHNYRATWEGCMRAGLTEEEAERAMKAE